MKTLLLPLEWLYRSVNLARRSLYRMGILEGRRLPRPVISVGNIAMGGAGKTPVAIHLARRLTERGWKVAILTRGYGREGGEEGLMESLDATKYGDEPVVIKKNAGNVDVIVGANRYDNAIEYLAANDCDLFVLDDGFQHLRLHRQFDLVIDAPRASRLREWPSALRHADHILVRGQTLHIRPHIAPLRPGDTVFAFSGLADNEQFFDALRTAGLTLAGTRGFPDHHRYTPADIETLRRDAARAGARVLVTTEKDAVKIPDQPDLVGVSAEVTIHDEEELLQTILNRIGR